MKRIASIAAALLLSAAAHATEIVYTPLNPSFGGNPLNGTVLMNSANAQNEYTDPKLEETLSRLTGRSQLDLFNQRLQALILDRIASSISGSLFDASGNLVPGQIETSTFIISIDDIGGGLLLITTTDKVTGASTSFEISATP
jgi:curli production assembly/transport component CsgF